MKFYIIVPIFLVCIPTGILSASKSKKKTSKTTPDSTETSTVEPAIIAIEIVDPNENSTTSKNSKRTIENSLGYGYNSFGASKPRYEVYRYSQHDIPPYKSSPNRLFQNSASNQVNIQKSVQYTLPPITQQSSNLLQPGTTLYSSLNGNGQVGGLSNSLPQSPSLEHRNSPVPVVVLRIYPNQLKDSTIHANLPKNHPFAKTINSLDIQSLLLQYIKTLKHPAPLSQYSINQDSYQLNHGSQNEYSSDHGSSEHSGYNPNRQNNHHRYTVPVSQTSNNYYNQGEYQNLEKYQPNDGSQNYAYYHHQQQSYPQQSDVRYSAQSQYKPEQYQNHNSGVSIQEAPLKYEISNYDSSELRYENPAIQKHKIITTSPAPQPQYYYVQQTAAQSGYSTESYQYFQSTPHVEYTKEQSLAAGQPQQQQYYTADEEVPHIQYYPQANQENSAKEEKLLTYENYPTDKHTRVIFRTKSGDIRTSQEQDTPTKEIKTIKIHVPENIAKVEVEESEQPHYGFVPTYPDTPQKFIEQPYDSYLQDYPNAEITGNYYLPQNLQSYYSNNANGTSDNIFNYQNVDYEEVAKYHSKRGAFHKHSSQGGEPLENAKDTKADGSKNGVSVYEDTFSTNTASTLRKKLKNKKRTNVEVQ